MATFNFVYLTFTAWLYTGYFIYPGLISACTDCSQLTTSHFILLQRCGYSPACRSWLHVAYNRLLLAEGSATKEISYTSWRNQLKSSWNHEKSKQISLKSSSEISPTLQPHPLLQRMTSFLREITGKSKRNQEISYAKIARCRPLVISTIWAYMIKSDLQPRIYTTGSMVKTHDRAALLCTAVEIRV